MLRELEIIIIEVIHNAVPDKYLIKIATAVTSAIKKIII